MAVTTSAEALRNPNPETVMEVLRAQVAENMPPDMERLYDVSIGEVLILEHHKENREYAKVMLRIPGVQWPNGNYGTVVAVQAAIGKMYNDLTGLGLARLSGALGGSGGSGNGSPTPAVPAPRPRVEGR